MLDKHVLTIYIYTCIICEMFEMAAKLTLTLNKNVIDLAKDYSKANNISISKLVESYLKAITQNSVKSKTESIPPIISSLSGIARKADNISDKDLLAKALTEKFL